MTTTNRYGLEQPLAFQWWLNRLRNQRRAGASGPLPTVWQAYQAARASGS